MSWGNEAFSVATVGETSVLQLPLLRPSDEAASSPAGHLSQVEDVGHGDSQTR